MKIRLLGHPLLSLRSCICLRLAVAQGDGGGEIGLFLDIEREARVVGEGYRLNQLPSAVGQLALMTTTALPLLGCLAD